MNRTQRIAIGVAVALTALVVAQTVQKQLQILVNGKASAAKALVVGNQTYVPITVLGDLGVQAKVQGNTVSLSATAATPPASSGTSGTTQLQGQAGEVGKAYTLGKDDKLNFTLTGVEYRLEPVTIRDVYSARGDQKLVQLKFTVQNPLSRDQSVSYNSFRLTLVDDRDVNYRVDSYASRQGENTSYETSLKPSQKVDLVMAWPVPAGTNIVKMLVERGDNAPIVRYDLRGKIKPLAAPFSTNGYAALEQVPAQVNTVYPLKLLSGKVESFGFTTEALDGSPPEEGSRYFTALISVRNLTANQEVSINYATFKAILTDQDGASQESNNYLVRATSGAQFETQLKPGAEVRFRIYFQVAKDLPLASFTLRETDGRTYLFDLKGLR